MALARAHVWNVGDLLKSNDLNGEFNNILLNPVALISPSTGAINFNLQAHTGILPSAITATSAATTGQALIYNGVSTTVVFGTPAVAASAVTIVAGTTGQVFAVTSSNSAPAFQVLPIDGGLSTTLPTAGMVYYISSSAGKLIGLAIGTSGQVLTISTALLPSWATAAAGSAATFGIASGNTLSSVDTWWDDYQTGGNGPTYANTSGTISYTYPTSGAGLTAPLVTGGPSGATIQAITFDPFAIARNPVITVSVAQETTVANTFKIGIGTSGTGATGLLGLTDPQDGLYFRTSASSTWVAVARNAGTEVTINTTEVGSTAFSKLQIRVTNGGTTSVTAQVFAGNVSQGSFTATQLSTQFMNFGIAQSASNTKRIDAWQIVQERPSTL